MNATFISVRYGYCLGQISVEINRVIRNDAIRPQILKCTSDVAEDSLPDGIEKDQVVVNQTCDGHHQGDSSHRGDVDRDHGLYIPLVYTHKKMGFTSNDLKTTVAILAFTAVAVVMIVFQQVTQFKSFQAALIFAFLGAFAAFQLIFYLKIEADVPKAVTKQLLQYALQIFPSAGTTLSNNTAITPEIYKKRVSDIKSYNLKAIVGSPLSIFAMTSVGLSLLFLVWHTKPFTRSFRMLNYVEYANIVTWLAVCAVHILLFLAIVKKSTFIYKADMFAYGVAVLRKACLSTLVQQAGKVPQVAKAADLKTVQPQITSFKNTIVSIDLDIANPPSIPARLRSASNRGVLILACLTVTVLAYSVAKSMLNGNRGYVAGLGLFVGLITFYLWLYSSTKQIQLKSTMDDPDLFAYEITH